MSILPKSRMRSSPMSDAEEVPSVREMWERAKIADTLDREAHDWLGRATTAEFAEELVFVGRAWGLRFAACVIRNEHPDLGE